MNLNIFWTIDFKRFPTFNFEVKNKEEIKYINNVEVDEQKKRHIILY